MKEKLTIALLKEAEDGSMASNETHEMKHSEAIEKIAKAIYEAMCPNFSQMFVSWRAYTKIAEAALNSLLEEHK